MSTEPAPDQNRANPASAVAQAATSAFRSVRSRRRTGPDTVRPTAMPTRNALLSAMAVLCAMPVQVCSAVADQNTRQNSTLTASSTSNQRAPK